MQMPLTNIILHKLFLQSRVKLYKSNTTGATCGAGTTYPSGASEFNLDFSGVRVARSLVFCVVFCTSLSFCLVSFGSVCLSCYELLLLITHFGILNFSSYLCVYFKHKVDSKKDISNSLSIFYGPIKRV